MKDSKKSIKIFTIAAALSIFGIGSAFAIQAAETDNSADVKVQNVLYAGNTVIEETQSYTKTVTTEVIQETETQIESAAETEAATEEVTSYTQNTPVETEAPTEAVVLSEDDNNCAQAQVNASVYSSYISQVFALINEERAAAGVCEVSYDGTLTVMACHRALENADNNSMTVQDGHHIRPNGQKASTICNYYGQYGCFGENLGRYQETPAEIIAGWHNSTVHYNCMVSSKYTRAGIGVSQDSQGNYYWTAIFMN